MIGEMLREWRDQRGLSQLDLSLEAEVSTRHLSFIESGRSRPTRDMVLRLAEGLALPLRERNALLLAAGFAPHYAANGLDSDELAEVRAAIRMILIKHEPFPAVALDAAFSVVEANAGFGQLLSGLGIATEGPVSLIDLVFAPGPVREAIVNWREVANYMAHRMRESLRQRGERSPVRPVFEAALNQPGVREALDPTRRSSGPPLVPVVLRMGGETTHWITTVTTFGAPQDAYVEELTIEQFFPVNPAPA